MKKITKLLFFIIFIMNFGLCNAQQQYETQWAKVEANLKKGLYKSNLPIILDLQKMALKDNNSVQLIRTLKAEFSILKETSDDENNDAASQFFTKLQTIGGQLHGDDKVLYDVMLGIFIQEYYQENRWQINQITNIDKQDFSQIETWSKLDFKNYLKKYYSGLDQQRAQLQRISLPKYKVIFSDSKDLDYFPNLYIWSSFEKIQFLKYQNLFTVNERKANEDEIKQTYDQLIAASAGNSQLFFRHQKISDVCGFDHCKNQIQQLEDLVNHPTEGDYKVMVILNIADILSNEQNYEQALSWLNKAYERYPKSPFLTNVNNLKNLILQSSLNLSYETTTLANQPIHVSVDYKNVKKVSFKIYQVRSDINGFIDFAFQNNDAKKFNSLKKSLLRSEEFSLPVTSDFKNHTTSLALKPVSSGLYVVQSFVDDKQSNFYYFIASNSRIIYQSKDANKFSEQSLKLVNRETGQPVGQETLQIFEYKNSYSKDRTLREFQANTDSQGLFQLKESNNDQYSRVYLVHIPKTNDYDILSVYGDHENSEVIKEDKFAAQIFLDRAIYRPGQKVYFKVVNTTLKGDKEEVSANMSQKITMFDANGQELSSQQFTTNAFGSYNGFFTLPKGQLNGTFSLRISDTKVQGYKDFNVEEYKRPKFEVTIEPIKGEYQYGETILLKGKAVMFSGVPLSDATVNYEIKKHNIRWMYFRWMPEGQSDENSILGSVKTNEQGEFTISLKLDKDETLDGVQVDNYEVTASVTDINGETQSATENVKVASVSHYIDAQDVESAFTDEKIQLKVQTKNYNGQLLNKSFHAKLSKLEAQERVMRSNFVSGIQDLPMMSREEFIQKFPHDYFSKDELKRTHKKIIFDKVQSSSKTSAKDSTMINLGTLDAGDYELELYNVEGSDTIKTVKTFSVWNKRFLTNEQKPFLEVVKTESEYKRSNPARLYVYSAVPNALVNIFVQNGDGHTKTETRSFTNGVLELLIPLPKDESVSQVNVQVQLVAFNDVQTKSVDLKIASDKQPLKIETVTFRDKLQPNVKETWTVKVSGDSDEEISAEILANMYDKSLDQFASNTFDWQKLQQNNYAAFAYDIRNDLNHEYFSQRHHYSIIKNVEIPVFRWYNELQGNFRGIRNVRNAAVAEVNMQMVTTDAALLEKVANDSAPALKMDENLETLSKVPVRENLNETAFFYPELRTDKNGRVSFQFTSPEALTQWKVMFLAHTKDARATTLEKTVITQKDFSVTPNYPRFLREGDEITFQSKISSLVAEKLQGVAQLQILDALTNEDISKSFNLSNTAQDFTLKESGNTVIKWSLKVPKDVTSVILKVVAKAGNFSDGEQKGIAILPNRMLVTDAVPLFIKAGQTKTFVLENLTKNNSATTTNVSNTLELTTNPIWEIMMALPSLKEDQNNSADVIFNKWFADVLAAEIFKANPKLKTIFEEYQSKGLLTSNLDKNQELKQLLLEETPWVLDAKDETTQMARLSRLFDVNNMRNSVQSDWADFTKLQNPDGGFSWYQGYPSSYQTSLYILKNLGRINDRLQKDLSEYQTEDQQSLVSKLITYVDKEAEKIYGRNRDVIWSNWVLDYLDSRHYWEVQYPLSGTGLKLKNAVISQAPKAKLSDFTFYGLHRAALLFNDYELVTLSDKFLTYLKETSTQSETQGVYWKQNLNDWGWYATKTVNHAGAIEAFQKLNPTDQDFIDEMKIWLITQKEVNHWESSRGTAEVIFTILNSGRAWPSADSNQVKVIWGGKPLEKSEMQATGYIKHSINGPEVNQNLGTVTITKAGDGVAQGGLFWQYYEDLDKIKSSESYISITKELYKKVKTINGEELKKIEEEEPLSIGDRVTVRMILNTDRAMEYLHLKDMRAAGLEPLNVISGYQWNKGIGYYQSSKDASTNFYIQYMPKGKFVFEYDLICNAAGTFSNGITTLQNYYAPQMNTHTQGTTVLIKP